MLLPADVRPDGAEAGGTLYRIAFHVAGPDPRAALRERADLSRAEREELERRLARLDAASRRGPWTHAVLQLTAERPATLAADLAVEAGAREARLQARRAQAQGAGADREPGARVPALAAWAGVPGRAR